MSLHLSKISIEVKLAENGMNHADLAREIRPSCSRQAIGDLMCRIGNGKGVRSKTAKKLANALNCPVTELVDTEWVKTGKARKYEKHKPRAAEPGDNRPGK